MHPRAALLPGLLLAVTPLVCQAEEPKPAAPADFTAVLKQLAALGVPDLTGAKWVSGERIFQDLAYGSPHATEEDDKAQSSYDTIVWSGWVIAEKGAVLRPGIPEMHAVQLKNPDPGNLPRDLDRMLKVLKLTAKELHQQHGYSAERDSYLESAVAGRALVFAMQILQSGDTVSANRLAAAVFENFPDREAVLNGAVSVIADARYRTACAEFAKSGDWKRYAASLKAMRAELPPGWKNRAACAKLLALVEKRAAGPAPALTLPAGVQGDAGTLAAFTALGEGNHAPSGPIETSQHESLWLLPDTAEIKPAEVLRYPYGPLPNVPEVKSLTKGGVAALPVLAAALGDETLTPIFHPPLHGFATSGESVEARTNRFYDALYRPMSRAEIARALILSILPDEDFKFHGMKTEALAGPALDFHKKHAGSTPAELASFYLKEGSTYQKQCVRHYLKSSEDPAVGKLFEDTLLASADIEAGARDALEYLRNKRDKGAGAPGFARKVVAKLKTNLALPDKRPEYEYAPATAGGLTRLNAKRLATIIREIEVFTAGSSMRESLLGIAVKPADEALRALNSESDSLDKMPLATRVPLLLETAIVATDPKVKAWCIGRIAAHGVFVNPGESAEKYVLPAPGSLEAKHWLALISDDKTKIFADETIGSLAASVLESLSEKAPPFAWAARLTGIVTRPDDLLQRRAKARLEGREIPAYPDPAKISAERLKTIVETAAATPDEKMEAFVTGLNPDELAAWGVWWLRHFSPEFPALAKMNLPRIAAPASLLTREKQLSPVVAKSPRLVTLSSEDTTFATTTLAAVGLNPGDVVNAARVETMCAALAKDAGKYSGGFFEFGRFGPSIGISFCGHREKIAQLPQPPTQPDPTEAARVIAVEGPFTRQLRTYASAFKYAHKDFDAIVVLMMPIAENRGNRVWRVKDGKIEAPKPLDAKYGESIPDRALIVVLTAADAKIIRGEK